MSRPMLIACGFAVLASACGTTGQVADSGPVFALDRDVAAEISAVDPNRVDVLPAAGLRLALQTMLTEHATLSNEAMRRAVDGEGLELTLVELTRNTDSLTLAIGLVYGPDGANAFDQLWTNHIEFFNRYGAALRADDTDELRLIRAELEHYETDFSDFVDVATGGNLDFHTVLHVLHSHVNQLLDQAEAWDRGDYEGADAAAREAFVHMDTIAHALASGISVQQPAAFPGEVDEPAATACAAARLAVDHAITGAAELSFARAAGDPDRVSAFSSAHDTLADVAVETVAAAERDALGRHLEALSGSASSPADRSVALAGAGEFTTSIC